MSYAEKSTLAMTTILVVVFGAYFALVLTQVVTAPARDVAASALLVPAVLGLTTIAVVSHVVLAVTGPRTAGVEDERDRLVDLRGEPVGGLVLAAGAFAALGLVIVRADLFWIGQALVVAIVGAEIAAGITRLVLYRRGVK